MRNSASRRHACLLIRNHVHACDDRQTRAKSSKAVQCGEPDLIWSRFRWLLPRLLPFRRGAGGGQGEGRRNGRRPAAGPVLLLPRRMAVVVARQTWIEASSAARIRPAPVSPIRRLLGHGRGNNRHKVHLSCGHLDHPGDRHQSCSLAAKALLLPDAAWTLAPLVRGEIPERWVSATIPFATIGPWHHSGAWTSCTSTACSAKRNCWCARRRGSSSRNG